MKFVLLFTLPLLLVACAAKPPRTVDISAHAVPGTTLPSEGIESVRYAENIKEYPLGRYIDPNNSRIMHEGHNIYRIETTAKWNLHPNEPVSVPLGPATHVRDSARTASLVGDELVMELNRQKEATKTVIQGGQVVSQKLGELTTALQQTQQVVGQNAQLKQDVNTTKQRLDALEEDLRKRPTQTSPPAIKTHADDKPEW